MPMYSENSWLEIHKRQQAENDPWKVQWPEGPKIPADANAKTAREIVASHKISEFVNQNLSDPEVRSLLPESEREFGPINVDEWEVFGKQSSKGWACQAFNGSETVKFRLSASLDQNHAITTAARAIREKYGTSVEDDLNELPEATLQMIQRVAVSDSGRAIVLYMQYRLPNEDAEEFAAACAKANRGDDGDLLDQVADPLVALANNEAIWFVFQARTPQLSPEDWPSFEQFVNSRLGNRAITLPALQLLFQEWQTDRALGTIAAQNEQPPTEEELRGLPDEALTSLYFQTLGVRRASRE